VDGFSFDWIERHARFRPGALAIVDLPSSREFSYSALSERVQKLAAILADKYSIQPRDRVAITARNRADHFTIQFATPLLSYQMSRSTSCFVRICRWASMSSSLQQVRVWKLI
jgi:non-ribosomal peptide synthetase component E (peptide arylation enzyme)